MSMKETYANIEDKWYSFLDSLEDKGIPVYKVVDPIENAGIPSFPVTIAILLVILGVLFWLVLGTSGTSSQPIGLTIMTQANGHPLEGAQISVIMDNSKIGQWVTGSNGEVSIKLNRTGLLKIIASKSNCGEAEKEIKAIGGNAIVTLNLNCSSSSIPKSCVTISSIIKSIYLDTPTHAPPVGCRVYEVNPDGTTKKLDWKVTNNGVLIFGTDCIPQDVKIRIDCYGYTGTYYIDQLKSYAETSGTLMMNPKSEEFSGGQTNGSSWSFGGWNGTSIIQNSTSQNGWGNNWSTGNATGWSWNSTSSNNEYTWMNWNGTSIIQNSTSQNGWNGTENEWGLNISNGYVDDNGNGVPDDDENHVGGQQNYANLIVTVLDKNTGNPLSGIQVMAVDANGSRLQGNKTFGTTSTGGTTTLVVPRQTLSIQAVDPNGVYATYTTPQFYPFGYVTIRLTKGWPTNVKVVQPDGRGVSSATVIVGNIKKYSDYQGNVYLTLTKGKEYSISAFKNGYKPANGEVTGGENTTLTLIPLTANNSGPLTLTILNPSRMDDPFPGVKIELVSSDGTISGTCTTDQSGECHWDKIYATSYQVMARTPLAYSYNNVGSIKVEAGRPNYYRLEVEPTQLPITVRTLVDGVPTSNVEVTLYRTYPDMEKITEGASLNSYLTFKAPAGNYYYLTATWNNESIAYHGSAGPFELESPKTIQLNIKKPNTKLSLDVPGTVTGGQVFYGKLSIGLPYIDQKTGSKFKKVIVNLWVGQPGSKFDPFKTPILIDKAPGLVYLSQTSQRPKIGVVGLSACNWQGGGGNVDLITQTSKGLVITITNYSPSTMTLNIPFLTRLGALSTSTQVHYRALYISDNARFSTGWKSSNISITPTNGWIPIPSGAFYLYKTGLSITPGQSIKDVIKVTNGSTAYLHILAVTRSFSTSAPIDFSITPHNSVIPLQFWGEITNGTKTWTIEKTHASTQINALDGTLKRSISANDIVNVTISLKVIKNGTIYIVPFSYEFTSQGVGKILTIHSQSVNNIPTPIPNVAGGTIVYVNFSKQDTGGSSYIGTFNYTDELPLYSKRLSAPRPFELAINLDNKNSMPVNINMLIEAKNGITLESYPSNIQIGAGKGKTILVKGIGPDTPQQGAIKIWLWENGTSMPPKPWQVLNYEPNDYNMKVSTKNVQSGNVGINENWLTEFTTSGLVGVTDDYGRYLKASSAQIVITNPDGSKQPLPTRVTYLQGTPMYNFTAANLEPGAYVNITLTSPKFMVTKEGVVQGTKVVGPKNLAPIVFNRDQPYWRDCAQIWNFWKQGSVTVIPQVNDYYGNQQIEYGAGSTIYDSYNISTYFAAKTDRGWKMITNSGSLALAPGETGLVCWYVKALGSLANNYNITLDMRLQIQHSGLSKTLDYFKNVSSAFKTQSAPVQPTGNYVLGNYTVIRDNSNLGDINYLGSCYVQLDKTGDLESASVCDATQISAVIASMMRKISKSNYYEKTITGGPYAIGNDYLTLNEINNMLRGYGLAINSMSVNGVTGSPITCGAIRLEIVKNNGYSLRVSENSGMPWCTKKSPTFFVGLLNLDQGTNDNGKMPYVMSNTDFINALQQVSNKAYTLLFGNGVNTAPPSGGDWYTIKWVLVNSSNVNDITNTDLRWIKEEMGDNNTVGFIRWYPENSNELVKLSNTYLFGIMFKPGIDESTVNYAKKCFIQNLINYWVTGNSSAIGTYIGNLSTGLVVPLDNCKSSGGINLNIPKYSIEISDSDGNNVTGKWVKGSVNLDLLVFNKTNIKHCVWFVMNDNGKSESQDTSWGNGNTLDIPLTGVDNDLLTDGDNTIYVRCFSKTVGGPLKKASVKIDSEPPKISGASRITLPLGLCEYEKHVVYTVTDSGSGVKECGIYQKVGDYINTDVKLGNCTEMKTRYGNAVKYNCTIGAKWNETSIQEWTGDNSITGLLLPTLLNASIVCWDNVGNTANQTINVWITGTNIDIEPVTTQCPALLSDGSIGTGECLFENAAYDKSTNTYYTNSRNSEQLCFDVTGADEIGVCYLKVVDQSGVDRLTKSITTPESGNRVSGTWCFNVDFGKLGEGMYNFTVSCVSAVKSNSQNKYGCIGSCRSENNPWSIKDCENSK